MLKRTVGLAISSLLVGVTLMAAQDITAAEALEHLTTRIPPTYPPLARQARIMGTVRLTVSVDEEGKVTDVRIDSGHPMLTGPAVDAVKKWKFRPFTSNDEPVEVTAPVVINFSLNRSPEDVEDSFQHDFRPWLSLAQQNFAAGTPDKLIAAAEGASKAQTLAHDAHHRASEAMAQLLLARVRDSQQKDATSGFENALALFREAEAAGEIPGSDRTLLDAHFYAGRNYFRAGNFAHAELPLRRALQAWEFAGVRGLEYGAQMARAASMLATTDLRLGRPKYAEEDCRTFKKYKSYLHGLELDQAAQACAWSH